jgi:hypothetical protein
MGAFDDSDFPGWDLELSGQKFKDRPIGLAPFGRGSDRHPVTVGTGFRQAVGSAPCLHSQFQMHRVRGYFTGVLMSSKSA